MDSYLKLSAQEMKQYERRIFELAPTEREATVEIITSWHEAGIKEGMVLGKIEGLHEGISQGISQGKETLVFRLLRRRIGTVPADLAVRLDTLSPDQLDDLGEALLDFGTVTDLEKWLARQ